MVLCRANTVAPEIISWKGFFRALEKLPRELLEAWLSRWHLSDEGVFKQADPTQTDDEAKQKLQRSAVKRAKRRGRQR